MSEPPNKGLKLSRVGMKAGGAVFSTYLEWELKSCLRIVGVNGLLRLMARQVCKAHGLMLLLG